MRRKAPLGATGYRYCDEVGDSHGHLFEPAGHGLYVGVAGVARICRAAGPAAQSATGSGRDRRLPRQERPGLRCWTHGCPRPRPCDRKIRRADAASAITARMDRSRWIVPRARASGPRSPRRISPRVRNGSATPCISGREAQATERPAAAECEGGRRGDGPGRHRSRLLDRRARRRVAVDHWTHCTA